jgi:hypothetical protein
MKRTLALAACTAVAFLTGCSSNSAQPDASQSTTVSTAQSAESASPSPSPGAGDLGTVKPGAVTACTGAGLSLKQLPNGNGAAGTVVVAISITNSTATSCTLNGYPDFTLTGRTTGATTDKPEPVTIKPGHLGGLTAFSHTPTTVTVPAGGTAGFLLAYGNVPQGQTDCDAATRMNLRLGNGTVTGPVQVAVCGEAMQVSPYVPSSELTLD